MNSQQCMFPSFIGSAAFATRGFVCMVISVVCAQSPVFSAALEGAVLTPLCAVFVLQPTLGATLEVAFHVGGGAALATAIAALAVSILPASFPAAVGVLAVVLPCMGMAEWPPTLKRYACGCLVIEILVWAMPAPTDGEQPIVDARWCARLLGSVAVGTLIAVAVAGVLPAQAWHEVRMRLRIVLDAQAHLTELVMHKFLSASSEPSQERQAPGKDEAGTASATASTEILVVSTVGVSSEEQRLAESVDLHASASWQLKLAAAALRSAAWEPVFMFSNCRDRLTQLLSQATARHHALQTMLTAQPLAQQHHVLLRNGRHAPFVGTRLRAHLTALTGIIARVLRGSAGTLPEPGTCKSQAGASGQQSHAEQLTRAVAEVSATVVASRRIALYRAGPEGQLMWQGAQLWSPMTLVHALLQIAEALAAREDFEPHSSTPCCCPCLERGAAICGWLRSCDITQVSRVLASVLSPLTSASRWYRTARLTISLIGAALVGWAAAPAIRGTTTFFWAPVSVAFVAGGSESGSYRTVVQRLLGTLLGSTAGLLIAAFCSQTSDYVLESAALAICLAVWSALMHMSRDGGPGSYWATVAAFTAPIIAINGDGNVDRIKGYALARMEMTWLGLCTFFIVAFALPVSARLAAQRDCVAALARLNASVVAATNALCVLETAASVDAASPADMTTTHHSASRPALEPAPAANLNVASIQATPDPFAPSRSSGSESPDASAAAALQALDEVDDFLARFPTLVFEAAYEPQLWGRPFEAVRERYVEFSAALGRGAKAARIVHTSMSALLRSRTAHAAEAVDTPVRSSCRHLPKPFAAVRASDIVVKSVHRRDSISLHANAFLPALRRLVGSVVRVHSLAAHCLLAVDALWWQTPFLASSSAQGSAGIVTPGARADLDRAAAALVEDVSSFTECYDEFLHAYVEAKLAAAVAGPFARFAGRAASAQADALDSDSATAATPLHADLLPPTDSLWLNSTSFALRELAAAALCIIRATREVRPEYGGV